MTKAVEGLESAKSEGEPEAEKDRARGRRWICRDAREGRGEVWRDEGSYAAEGQLLVVERMTNRLSAAKNGDIQAMLPRDSKIRAPPARART